MIPTTFEIFLKFRFFFVSQKFFIFLDIEAEEEKLKIESQKKLENLILLHKTINKNHLIKYF